MKKTTILAAALASATVLNAEEVFQLSLTPDIAIHSRDTTIRGVSLGIWSENPQHSFTWGFVNGSTGQSSGLSLGLVNYTENYTGVHFAFGNYSKSSFTGLQLGGANISEGAVKGLQLGFVNYTESLHGLQLGFLNIVKDNGWFDKFPDKLATAFPFVNWSF